MKLLIKHSFSLELLIVLMLFVVLYSCQKEYRGSEPLTSEAASLSNAQRSLKQSEESADVVYQWYNFMAALQRNSAQPNPLVATRRFAYIGIGLFESVQPGIKGGSSFGSKLIDMPVMPKPDNSKKYLWSASANAALASLFKMFALNLSPANMAAIDANEAAIRNQLKLMPTAEDVLQRSEVFGRSIASAIWDWSTTDNFSTASTTYIQLNEPWAWVPTPTALAAPFAADLRYSRPLLKYSRTALAPPIPVPFSVDPNSAFYAAAKEVQDLGGSLTATAANKATANWWADAGGVGVGVPAPYHLISIVTSVLESQHSGLWKAAEVYAKTGIALKDGAIITFRSKFHYNLIRPITYIRRHNNDANWLSYLPNPAYPDYTSGLVGFFGPLTQVLINEFGDIPVTDNTYGWRGDQPRQFNSISQLRLEAAISRVYAGLHYRFTQLVSIDMGIELANEIDKIRVVGPEYE